MEELDKVLFDALSPNCKPDEELNQKVLEFSEEESMNKITHIGRKRFSATAAAVALALVFTSVSAIAAWKYLSADEVAKKAGDSKLAQTLEKDNLWTDSVVESFDGYDISLLGLVSGKNLSEYLTVDNGEVLDDCTYAVVAIAKSDGTPMPDISDEDYGKEDFLVSPYIEGYDPSVVNIFSLGGGGYSAIVEDGIMYRIMEVENIECFADHNVYLGVSDGTFYNTEAFHYDESTGKISRDESYDGVNALFALPFDDSKADNDKAKSIITGILSEDGGSDVTEENGESEESASFMAKITPENIDSYATPIESTKMICTPDEEGIYDYSYDLNDLSGSGSGNIRNMFPDGKTGMSNNIEYFSFGDGIEDIYIETHTLNEDGTVTYELYEPILK